MAALVERAQRGDREAFDRIYAAHVGRVYALCLRMSADPVRARRLVQDVFVRAWQKLDSFRGQSLFSSWLHRLAVNVVLDDQRSAKRGVLRLETSTEDIDAVAGAVTHPVPLARMELERALAALPQGARTVLVLHAIEGYRYEEVAEMTGLALGTVKAQIHRARKLLREALQ